MRRAEWWKDGDEEADEAAVDGSGGVWEWGGGGGRALWETAYCILLCDDTDGWGRNEGAS